MLAALVTLARPALADNPAIEFDGTPQVLGGNGSYTIDMDLNVTGLPNYTYDNLKLIGVVDTDSINPPFVVQGLYIGDAGQDGNILTSMTVPDNPEGKYFRVFLLDADTFLQQGGAAMFLGVSNPAYDIFINTDIITLGTETGNGNNNNNNNNNQLGQDFNPEEDCLDILYIDEPECQDFLNGGDGYNSDFQLTSTLQNPLGEQGDIDLIAFLQRLFNMMVKIALPFLILFTIYSGFLFVEARGNSDKLDKAKEMFKYVIIGGLIIFAAWTIAEVLQGTVEDIVGMSTVIEIITKIT